MQSKPVEISPPITGTLIAPRESKNAQRKERNAKMPPAINPDFAFGLNPNLPE
jgi:hypothetical protein